MASGTTQFDNIFHGLSQEIGKFRIASSGMAWKGEQAENISLAAPDLKWAQWLRVARNFQLRVGLKDRRRETFDGFMREDHDKLASLFKQHFSITLETKDITFKGWNWGVTDIQGQDLAFLVSNKTAFEVQLGQVANSNIAGRTEVSLEFTTTSSTKSKSAPDELTEIRFYVPGTQSRTKASDHGSQQSGAEDDDDETSAAQAFHDAVKEKADISRVTGDLVLSFEEILVLTPRGRYDLDMFLDFLRLRGKTYDYKILYSSISRLFLLPKDDQHVLFILSLTTPIRQGQTRYQYLVMQFSQEEEITAELNMSEEDVAKYDRLKKHYEDPTFEVVSSVFRALAQKKIIGAGSFRSRDGRPGIKANLKAVQGDLFFLEKYVFFVSKQPSLIELSDIQQVVYSRVGANIGATTGRTFDLKIVTKSGTEYTFTSINKEEHEPTEVYLKDKKIKIKNEMVPDADLLMAAADDDDDDDDDDMQSVESDDDAPRIRVGGGDDDSAEDEDFQASASDSGSPSDSDSSSGGETASDASGDRELENAAKVKSKAKAKAKAKDSGDNPKKSAKKAKKSDDGNKPKKKKAAKKAKSDSEDDGDEKPKKASLPRPKPKAKEKHHSDSEAEGSKSKSKPKPKPKNDAMDVDEDRSAPKPKPKPVAKDKSKEGKDERPTKKQKTVD